MIDLGGSPPSATRRLAGRAAADRRPRRHRWIAVGALLAVYPVAFMAPVLRPGTHRHLRNPFAARDLITDYDGGVRFVQLLSSMPWPWSTTPLVSYPTGEHVWRWQTVTQGLQTVAMFVLSRVCSGTMTLNLLSLAGWVLTGVAVYVLARRLGAPVWTACLAGLLAQLMPSVPTMASNYLSYVYVCVPLFTVIRCIDWSRAPTRRNAWWLAAALVTNLFFDPYWFYFSIVAVVLTGVFARRRLRAWYREASRPTRVVVLCGLAAPAVVVVLVLLVDRTSSSAAMSRPLGVATATLVDAGLRSPADWFGSRDQGMGHLLPVLGLGAMLWSIVRRRDRQSALLAAVTVTFILLSTRTRVETPWFTVESVAVYARVAMPGVRFFQRAALIAEAGLCVFAAAGVAALAHQLRQRASQVVGCGAALTIVVADLGTVSHHATTDRWADFAPIREVLAESPQPVLLALPFERHGRSWMELSLLDGVATLNPLYDTRAIAAVEIAASRGGGELAAYLAEVGVTHVLAIDGEAENPFAFALAAPRFVPRASIVLDSYGAAPETARLYDVHPQPGDVRCTGCAAGALVELIDGADARGDVLPLETQDPRAPSWWWMDGPSAEFRVRSVAFEVGRVGGSVRMMFGPVPCVTDRRVIIEHAGRVTEVVMEGNRTFDAVVPVSADDWDEPFRVSVQGDACHVPGDARRFYLQVFVPTTLADLVPA